MKIPNENLTAMIEFLTEQSETNGDHFMIAAAMLRTQRDHIKELEQIVSEHVEVERQWNGQRVGKLCGVPLGASIRAAVEPTLVRLIAENEQMQSRIADLEKQVEWWQSCTKDCGDVINDGIESRQLLRAECDRLRSKVAELEQKAAIGRKALESIALWPDGGNNYGQPKIKAFVAKVLAEHAAVGEK